MSETWKHAFNSAPRHCWYGDMKDEYVPAEEVKHIVDNPILHGTVEWLRFIRKWNKRIPGIFGEPRFETDNKKYHIEVYPAVGEAVFRVFIPRKKGSTADVIIECYDAELFEGCDSVVEDVRIGYSKAGTPGFSMTGLVKCE